MSHLLEVGSVQRRMGNFDGAVATLRRNIYIDPRSPGMQYKGTNKDVKVIGRELGTRYVLFG